MNNIYLKVHKPPRSVLYRINQSVKLILQTFRRMKSTNQFVTLHYRLSDNISQPSFVFGQWRLGTNILIKYSQIQLAQEQKYKWYDHIILIADDFKLYIISWCVANDYTTLGQPIFCTQTTPKKVGHKRPGGGGGWLILINKSWCRICWCNKAIAYSNREWWLPVFRKATLGANVFQPICLRIVLLAQQPKINI